jgi:hypothetical protein
LPYTTNGCSPDGCLAAAARSVPIPLHLHGFADFANYQLPEIGSMVVWRFCTPEERAGSKTSAVAHAVV